MDWLQAAAFLGPTMFLGLACKLAGGGADNETLTVGTMPSALRLCAPDPAGRLGGRPI